ncbi:pectate lyase [Colletotrichum orchidophilum]|uniref:Pectate lyase n=1 Tax=Colletotrichum orchidophilum TaxID=1209926 RepID=A0A1G4AUA0_9PEZI|nr:pectate lyase [Colletotrichum orchidophilum]OHE92749.1 pectate lyase [Colletotrichum orchidophilum]
MHQYYLLALLPAALGCLNADTNACASYIKSNAAASTFCATFTKSTITATTALPTWATNCSKKPSLISSECSCAYSSAGGSAPTTTLKTTTVAGGPAPTGVTTTLPQSAGATSTSAAITVSAGQSYDGGMKKFDRSPRVCAEQKETGEADAMFVLEAGATLSNVIIGPDQAEGVHCKGTCNNVWWADVCEDALTLEQPSGTSYVIGGGAFKAADKIIQFNGFGTVSVENFYANDGNGGARNIILKNVIAKDGGVLCGINTNYGDTCKVTSSCQDDNKICDRYKGNNNGDEPPKIGSGPDGTYCVATSVTSAC